jgi:hypothetical protein
MNKFDRFFLNRSIELRLASILAEICTLSIPFIMSIDKFQDIRLAWCLGTAIFDIIIVTILFIKYQRSK